MDDAYILNHVDHTLLQPFATWSEIEQLCHEAIEFKTASVCIPPCYVKRARNLFQELVICTVIGFPLGYDVTTAKLAAARTALDDGTNELDMVINLTDVKTGNINAVRDEIGVLRDVCGSNILKVIVETCYLTDDEKALLCRIVTETGADYIKTSTGFGTAGAALDDVLLFKSHLGPNVKIKASGGIRTRDDMVTFIEAGCSRLGTSSAVIRLKGVTN